MTSVPTIRRAMVYMDHAATSFPKPDGVHTAMAEHLRSAGNPGRSGHRLARAADETLWQTRRDIAALLGVDQAERVVFTAGATTAINVAIKGLVQPGDRVLTSSFEHNAVVRPLHALVAERVTWRPVPPSPDEPVDLDHLERELRGGPIRLVVLAHASNVTGAVVPLAPIRSLTERYGATLVLDAAQTVGHIPVRGDDADVVVFAGHKGMLGPTGTGGMYVSDRLSVRPLLQGGTGGRSELREQPRWLPWSLEAGTPNGVGIAGLGAAVRYVAACGPDAIAARERRLRDQLVAGVRDLPGVALYEQGSSEPPVGVISVNVADVPAVDAAALLEERHDVLVRGGMHCAPLAHQTLGTLPGGTVRLSLSHLNSESDVAAVADAVAALAESVRLGHDRPSHPVELS